MDDSQRTRMARRVEDGIGSYRNPPYLFRFDLKRGAVLDSSYIEEAANDAVRYTKDPDTGQVQVEIGNVYRHYFRPEPRHWNRVLKMIRDELDESGIETILVLMSDGLREEYRSTFLSAVRSGVIKETDYFL